MTATTNTFGAAREANLNHNERTQPLRRFGVRASAFALLVLMSSAAPSCSDAPMYGDAETSADTESNIGATEEAISDVGIERTIPIRFITLVPGCSGDAAQCNSAVVCPGDTSCSGAACPSYVLNTENLLEHTASVNQTFQVAGVQFYVQSIEQYAMPGVTNLNAGSLSWSQVRSGLRQVFPNITCSAGAALANQSLENWIVWASIRYASPNSIPAWAWEGYGHGFGIYPWRGRSIIWDTSILNNVSDTNYAHELGHFFGLPHVFDSPVSLGSGSYNLERNTVRDPVTGAYLGFSAFWDLVYKPGTSNPPVADKYYNTQAEAEADENFLVAKNRWDINPPRCTLDNTCTYTCNLHDGLKSTGSAEMSSLSFTYQGDDPAHGIYRRGINVMDYNENPACAANSLSGSQVAQVRKVLRFDVALDDDATMTGKRPLLGQAIARPVAYKLDIDNDGKRDAMVWEPPPNNGALGTFRTLKATHFEPLGAPVVVGFGHLGDIPIPADYDGDGKTDYALWRTLRNATGGLDPTSKLAYWDICGSATNTTNCNNSTSIQFGERTDIPLPGTNFDGLTSTGEIAVFRPRDGKVYWKIVGGADQSPISTTSTGYGKVPLLDDYNGDGKTDVVLWDPSTARFDLVYSPAWSTPLTYQFPSTLVPGGTGTAAQRSGGVVSQGSYANVIYCDQQLCYSKRVRTLQVYSPDDGVWYTYNPYYGLNGSPTTCAFGAPGDVPLSGIIDRNGDGTSDYAVYRALGTNGYQSGSGTVWIRNNLCQGSSDFGTTSGQYNTRTSVSATGDMTGDGQSEILRLDTDTMSWYVLRSEGYNIKYSFQLGSLGAMAL